MSLNPKGHFCPAGMWAGILSVGWVVGHLQSGQNISCDVCSALLGGSTGG